MMTDSELLMAFVEYGNFSQTGFMNLLKGLFGMFRNTTAHVPKIKWVIEEKDALDILSLVSLIHRRLDSAIQARKIAKRSR